MSRIGDNRPGKLNKPVEFSAKLSVSLNGDRWFVDYLRWDVFHEGGDLQSQVETYRARHGHYPQAVWGNSVRCKQAGKR